MVTSSNGHRWIPLSKWSPMDSSHKSQWRGALIFSFVCAWPNGSANHRDAGDLRCDSAHYCVTLIYWPGKNVGLCNIKALIKQQAIIDWFISYVSIHISRASMKFTTFFHTHISKSNADEIFLKTINLRDFSWFYVGISFCCSYQSLYSDFA